MSSGILKNILRPTLILFSICLLVTLAVAGTNALTEERIAAANEASLRASMGKVLSAESYEELENPGAQVYKALNGGELLGYIIVTDAKGYGGDVSVMTGIVNGAIAAIDVVNVDNETPGLGQNAQNAGFTDQFKGLAGAPEISSRGRPSENGIDAITGATITSRAVTEAVGRALEIYETL